ncbi:MAG: sulfotransferase [Chloroflexota bacterium]
MMVTPLPEHPFFIVGHPRSGTTLLRFILSSHPRLYVPDETGFIPSLLRRSSWKRDLQSSWKRDLQSSWKRDLQVGEVEAILREIGRLNRHWAGLVEDAPAFYAALAEPDLAHVLDALYRRQKGEQTAARWGDKTPTYVRHIPALSQLFPTAQFIHLIRDARDATLSAQKKWSGRRPYMDSYYLLKQWARNVAAGRAAGHALGPTRYLEVFYEEMVQTPRPVIERICHFLGEDFQPVMLDHARLARQTIGPGGHVEVREPISTQSVGRWRTRLSPFDQKLADHLIGPLLASLGYELSGRGPFTTAERLRVLLLAARFRLVDTTRTALYAAGWLTLNRGKRGGRWQVASGNPKSKIQNPKS